MKPGDDKELSAVLNRWKVDAPLPGHVRTDVWKRIADVESSRWSIHERIRAWLEMAFGRQAFTVSYVAVLLAIGLTAGILRGRQAQRQAQADLSGRYVESVSLYQRMP